MRSLIPALALVLLLVDLAAAQPWMEAFQQEGQKPTIQQMDAAFDAYWATRSPQRATGYKQYLRARWFREHRLQADGSFDPSALARGFEELKQSYPGSELDEADWSSLGPHSTTNDVGGLGRINALAFHPTDSLTLYVGAASGGCWKSTDGGSSWTVLTDAWPVLGVTGIAVHPTQPETLWIATGDGHHPGSSYTNYSFGILRSTDGGASWDSTGLNWDSHEGVRIARLVVHPTNGDILLAGSFSDGIWRTADGGQSWTQVATGGAWRDIEVDPNNGNVWLAARQGNAVYRSTDAGQNFTAINAGLPTTNIARIQLAFSRSQSNTVYALYTASDGAFRGLWRSTDNGVNWSERSTTPNLFNWTTDGSGGGGIGWYSMALEVDPADPDIVYVGCVNGWRSSDGGTTWQLASHWYGGGGAADVHADHHIYRFNNNRLYMGNDGGIYYTDEGFSYTDISDGLVITETYRLGHYAGSDSLNRLIQGCQDNNTSAFLDSAWYFMFGGDGMDCGIDPLNPLIGYGHSQNGNMNRTTDGGYTWTSADDGVTENGAWISPFVIDTTASWTLYRATDRIYKSANYAASWFPVSAAASSMYTTMAIAPSDGLTVYAATNGSRLIVTTDGGSNWTIQSLPRSGATWLTVHPHQPNVLFATFGGYTAGQKLYRSDDYGDTWTNISGDLPNIPCNTVVLHAWQPEHMYLGTELGVLHSPDGGQSWVNYTSNMPPAIVTELEIHLASNTLIAGTYGRGVWTSPAMEVDAGPWVQLNSPRPGESLEVDSTVHIAWSTLNAGDRFAVELTRSWPDTSWELLVADTSAVHSVDWVVSGPTSAEARLRIRALDAPGSSSATEEANPILPSRPLRSFPGDGDAVPSLPLVFDWSAAGGALSYQLQLSEAASFDSTQLLLDESGVPADSFALPNLADGIYSWRVRAFGQGAVASRWSSSGPFAMIYNDVELEAGLLPESYELVGVYPNPFNATATVVVALPERAQLKVTLYNVEGRRVTTLSRASRAPGLHRLALEAGHLASGVYFVQVEVPGELNARQRVTLVK